MSTPAGHILMAAGAYLGATAPNSFSKLRGTSLLCLAVVMALLPDALHLLAAIGLRDLIGQARTSQVTAILHGLPCGFVAAAALAGAIPSLRENFWSSVFVLFAAHASHALLDWLTWPGAAWLAPFDWTPRHFQWPFLPSADARAVSGVFIQTLKIMLVEVAILLPPVWTTWILGREGGESRTKSLLAVYALSWPLAAGLAFWCSKNGGRL